MLFSVAVIIRSWDHLLFLEIFPFGQGGHRLEQTSNRALPSHAPFLFGNMRHQDYSQLSEGGARAKAPATSSSAPTSMKTTAAEHAAGVKRDEADE
jgi:hypothetical protein